MYINTLCYLCIVNRFKKVLAAKRATQLEHHKRPTFTTMSQTSISERVATAVRNAAKQVSSWQQQARKITRATPIEEASAGEIHQFYIDNIGTLAATPEKLTALIQLEAVVKESGRGSGIVPACLQGLVIRSTVTVTYETASNRADKISILQRYVTELQDIIRDVAALLPAEETNKK